MNKMVLQTHTSDNAVLALSKTAAAWSAFACAAGNFSCFPFDLAEAKAELSSRGAKLNKIWWGICQVKLSAIKERREEETRHKQRRLIDGNLLLGI